MKTISNLRKLLSHLSLTAVLTLAATLLASPDSFAEKLVILHTNDTHSHISPKSNGLAGIARRKAVVDSVRAAEKNVLLVDAGDQVQGTLYFTIYGGEVEHKAMNAMGYDIAILGNHEFDNGMQSLADLIANDKMTWISTNYDLEGTPLEPYFVPYVIKEYEGKRIAFMAINLNPDGIISSRNWKGLKYNDIYKAANSTAWALKHNEKADMVIALTHIGYEDSTLPSDITLAENSEDIDLIIGGHTHTVVDPADPDGKQYIFKNLNGEDVLIAQTGCHGENLGMIEIDLETLTPKSSLISIDCRLDSRLDPDFVELLLPYRSRIDSLMSIKVATSADILNKQQLTNLFGDLVLQRGKQLAGNKVDFGFINNGGVRNDFPKGMVSEGDVMMTLPFDNRIRIIEVPGFALADAINNMISRDMNGLSSNVDVTYDPSTKKFTQAIINGKPLDNDAIYTIATIDYIADGGDYMASFRDFGKTVASSDNILYRDITDMLKKEKKKLNPSSAPRIHP